MSYVPLKTLPLTDTVHI